MIYRRYPSRALMVVDAWIRHAPADLPTRTTGSLREDLLALGRAIVGRFERIGLDTLRGLMAEVDEDFLPHLDQTATASAQEILGTVIDAARQRGEIGPEPLPPASCRSPWSSSATSLLFQGHIDEAALTDMVDTVCLPLLTAGRGG